MQHTAAHRSINQSTYDMCMLNERIVIFLTQYLVVLQVDLGLGKQRTPDHERENKVERSSCITGAEQRKRQVGIM